MLVLGLHKAIGTMLDFRRLRYFAAVAQHGSIAAAARAMNVAQPGLSHHVAELERIVGFRLFERLPRGVKLTEGGKLLLDHALIILDQVSLAERMVKAHLRPDPAQSILRLGLLPSWSAAYGEEIRRAIKSAYPETSLMVIELRHEEATRMVASEEIDLAIMLRPCGAEELAAPIAREQLCTVSAGPLPPTISLSRLADFKLIVTTSRHPDRLALEKLARKHGIGLDIVLEVDGQKTLVKAVSQGLGAGVMVANGALAEIAAGVLHAAPITEPRFTREVWLGKAPKVPADLAVNVRNLIRSIAMRGGAS